MADHRAVQSPVPHSQIQYLRVNSRPSEPAVESNQMPTIPLGIGMQPPAAKSEPLVLPKPATRMHETRSKQSPKSRSGVNQSKIPPKSPPRGHRPSVETKADTPATTKPTSPTTTKMTPSVIAAPYQPVIPPPTSTAANPIAGIEHVAEMDKWLDEQFPTKFAKISPKRHEFPDVDQDPKVWTADCMTVIIHGIQVPIDDFTVKLKCREVEFSSKQRIRQKDLVQQTFDEATNLIVCKVPVNFSVLLLHNLKIDLIPKSGTTMRGRIPLRWTVCGQCQCTDATCGCGIQHKGRWVKSIGMYAKNDRNPDSDSEADDDNIVGCRMTVSLALSFTGRRIAEMLDPKLNPFVETFVLPPILNSRILDAQQRARTEIARRQAGTPHSKQGWWWEEESWTPEDLQRLLLLNDQCAQHDVVRKKDAILKAIAAVQKKWPTASTAPLEEYLPKVTLVAPELVAPPRTSSITPGQSHSPAPTASPVPTRSPSPSGVISPLPIIEKVLPGMDKLVPGTPRVLVHTDTGPVLVPANATSPSLRLPVEKLSATWPTIKTPVPEMSENKSMSIFGLSAKQNYALKQAAAFTSGVFKEDWDVGASTTQAMTARGIVSYWSSATVGSGAEKTSVAMQRTIPAVLAPTDAEKLLPERLQIMKYAMMVYGWFALTIFDGRSLTNLVGDVVGGGDVNRFCSTLGMKDSTADPFAADAQLLHWHAPGIMGGKAYDPTFCIVRDTKLDAILWVVRGTNDLEMAVTDLAGEYDFVDSGTTTAVSHSGFMRTARFLLHNFFPRLWLLVRHHAPSRLIFSGHSLGAGVATCLAMLVNRDVRLMEPLREVGIKSVTSVAFATPGVLGARTGEENLAELDQLHEHWVVHNDNVPGMTYGSCMDWRELNRVAQEVVRKDIWKGDGSNTKEARAQLLRRCAQRMSGDIGNPKLGLPGRSYYVFPPSVYADLKIPLTDCSAWGEQDRGLHVVSQVPPSYFTELVRDVITFGGWAMKDHLPGKYIVGMDRCFKRTKGVKVPVDEKQVLLGDAMGYRDAELEACLVAPYI